MRTQWRMAAIGSVRKETEMDKIIIGAYTVEIQKQCKTGFIATWIFGMLAHAYRFFNFLPIWDTMYNFKGTGATFYSGRCFLGFFSGLSTEYDMAWLNGAFSLFYISIVVILLIDMFQIKSKLSAVIMAALIVTFPTVTSTFAYMFTADGYMMAFLLSVLGVYCTWKWKYGIFPGIAFIGLSMGTYQAYISVTLMVVVLLVLTDLLIERKTFKELFFEDWKYLAVVLGGAVFYKVVSGIINAYYGIVLTGYQGIDSVGIMSLGEYAAAVRKSLSSLSHFWCLQNGLFATNKYGLVNACVMGGIILATILLVIKNKTYKNVYGLIITILALIVLPFIPFSINFVSPGTSYHTLMQMGICFIYILLLLYLERGEWKHIVEKALKIFGIFLLVFLCYFNTLQANRAYTNMTLSYEKSYGIAGNILDRIEQLEEYPEISKVAMLGSYHADSSGYEELNPTIMGVSQDTFLWGDYHYISMWNYCFGRSFALSSGEEKAAIQETKEYQEMSAYPAKDCIAVINDTIVIKLSE